MLLEWGRFLYKQGFGFTANDFRSEPYIPHPDPGLSLASGYEAERDDIL